MHNKYEVLCVVGEGAYGIVYKCRNKETNEIVAIKKFKETEDELVKKTIKRELKVLKILKHENIVEFKEAIKYKKKLYIVFEYMEKNVLELLQQKPNGLDQKTIKYIIFQLCKAIKYLHSNNIIHRDVKPENLLINSSNKLKLCDFGFARRINQKENNLTDYVATRWYRSPELIILNGIYNFEIDYWAIGCIMGELVDGNPIFPGENEVDQLHCIQKILGNFPQEYIDLFYNNPLFHNMELLDVKNPQGLERRYLGKLSKVGIDFLKSLLQLDPKKRLGDDNVLEHPYFSVFFKNNSNKKNNDDNYSINNNSNCFISGDNKVDSKGKDINVKEQKENENNNEKNVKNEKDKGLINSVSNKNINCGEYEKILKKIIKNKFKKNEDNNLYFSSEKEKNELESEKDNIIENNQKKFINSNSTTNINIININTYNNQNDSNLSSKLSNSNEIKYVKKTFIPQLIKKNLKKKKIKGNKNMTMTMTNQIHRKKSNSNSKTKNQNKTMISDLNNLTSRQKYETLNNDISFIQNFNQEKYSDRGISFNIFSLLNGMNHNKNNNISNKLFGFKTFYKNKNDKYNYNINTHFSNVAKNYNKKPRKTRHSSIIEEVEEAAESQLNMNNHYIKKEMFNNRKSRSLNNNKKMNCDDSTVNDYNNSPIKEKKTYNHSNKSNSPIKNKNNNQTMINNKNNNGYLMPNLSTYNIGFKDKNIKGNNSNQIIGLHLPSLNKRFHANIMKFYQMISNK